MENAINEIWKDIDGYEEKYKVSNLGRVKSINYNSTGKEKILKPVKDKDGYLFVILSKKGKCKRFSVHRLVAQTFIENPNNLPFINHKDENKTNNSVENLEWCDRRYNNNYGTRNERIGVALSKQVKCLETGVVYSSTWQAKRETGVSQGNISSCCNGKYKTAGGYHWEFVEDGD